MGCTKPDEHAAKANFEAGDIACSHIPMLSMFVSIIWTGTQVFAEFPISLGRASTCAAFLDVDEFSTAAICLKQLNFWCLQSRT